MSRFLEADKVLVFKLYDDLTEEFYEKEFTIENFIDTYAVDGCPKPVDAVQHGHWVMLHKTHNVDEDNDYDWRCSECNHVDCHNINVEVPYCWYCGALMDEEEAE